MMEADIGIISLVPDTWNPLWQTRHHVLSRLSKHYNIVWVNPAHGTDFKKLLFNRKQKTYFNPVSSSLTVYAENPWLPRIFRSSILDKWIYNIRLRKAVKFLKQRGCKRFILYIWRPEHKIALDMYPWDATCYHIDDEYTFSDQDLPISHDELALIKNVDQVFIHSEALYKKKGHINPNTTIVPNGVDFFAYAAEYAMPKELLDIPKPIIGYSGFLKRQLDWALIETISSQLPMYSFVFVGGLNKQPQIESIINNMSKLDNVYFLGSQPASDLPKFVKYFDICIMPYRITSYTNYINPLKLYEYLASGNPVISTPIQSLISLNKFISLAEGSDEWVSEINNILSQKEIFEKDKIVRAQIAKKNDWQTHVDKIKAIFDDLVRL